MARNFYAQAADSASAHEARTLGHARELAKSLSMGPVTAAVYENTGTGFDPLIERYRKGRCVFRQSAKIRAQIPNPVKR